MTDELKDAIPFVLSIDWPKVTEREGQIIGFMVVAFYETQMNAYRMSATPTHSGMTEQAKRDDMAQASIEFASRLTGLLRRFFPDLSVSFGVPLNS